MRARTGAPSSSAFCADISTTAAPASFMPEALPAVTVPSGLNTGFSLPRPSIVASGRTCSSRANSLGPFLDFSSTGTISSSNRPCSCARAARRCDSTENSSCCLAADVVRLRQVLRGDAHVDVVERVGEPADDRVDHRRCRPCARPSARPASSRGRGSSTRRRRRRRRRPRRSRSSARRRRSPARRCRRGG